MRVLRLLFSCSHFSVFCLLFATSFFVFHGWFEAFALVAAAVVAVAYIAVAFKVFFCFSAGLVGAVAVWLQFCCELCLPLQLVSVSGTWFVCDLLVLCV